MTTCQICGRAIKANTGLIAHHGYKQPWGDGQRTQSCPGSRHLPYEVSRDAIPGVRANYARQGELLEARVADWVANPPATIHAVRRDAYGAVRTEQTLTRPDGFDAEKNLNRGGYRLMTYELEHATRLRRMRAELSGLVEAIAWLTERYDGWVVAPAS